jgi:hypothetical protein
LLRKIYEQKGIAERTRLRMFSEDIPSKSRSKEKEKLKTIRKPEVKGKQKEKKAKEIKLKKKSLLEKEAALAMERAANMNREAGKKKTENTPIIKSQEVPKIWLTKNSSFKKCQNCLSLHKGNTCMKYKHTVSKNNVCKAFYAPKVKVYLGGTFSPR